MPKLKTSPPVAVLDWQGGVVEEGSPPELGDVFPGERCFRRPFTPVDVPTPEQTPLRCPHGCSSSAGHRGGQATLHAQRAEKQIYELF